MDNSLSKRISRLNVVESDLYVDDIECDSDIIIACCEGLLKNVSNIGHNDTDFLGKFIMVCLFCLKAECFDSILPYNMVKSFYASFYSKGWFNFFE